MSCEVEGRREVEMVGSSSVGSQAELNFGWCLIREAVILGSSIFRASPCPLPSFGK
jgi:hypothetical protein